MQGDIAWLLTYLFGEVLVEGNASLADGVLWPRRALTSAFAPAERPRDTGRPARVIIV